MKRQRRSEGFTLMELMVVLFIAGLLAALAVTAAGGYIRRASNLSLVANIQSIVRSVPLQARKNLCVSHLSINLKAQSLEAWVCGTRQKQVMLDMPYSIKLVDHAPKVDAQSSEVSTIWYTPRSGGASARLDIYDGTTHIQSIDLSVVTSYHADR